MFAVLTKHVHRRVVYRATRCLSQHSPPPPPPPPRSSSGNKKQPVNETSPQPTSVNGENEPKINISELPSLDFVPAEHTEEPKRTGARSAQDTLTTGEKQRRHAFRLILAMFGIGLGGNIIYMGREWENEELERRRIKIEDAPSTRWGRTTKRFMDFFNFFSEPVWPELLPPPLPPPYHKPYTLLVSIDDLLVTSTWDRQYGWRTAKRPGVDYFLGYISQFYELVVFTTQHSYTAMPVLEKLDRYNFFISHRLCREHTRSVNGRPVKDLSYLNRDLSKVVCLDTDLDHYSSHPENAVIIPKWNGDPKDTGLIAMIPFLESIAIYKPPDVRPILSAYQGKNIPLEYAKKEAEAKAKHTEEWKRKGRSVASGSAAARLLGLRSSSESTDGVPPTYLEQKRKEAQFAYLQDRKYLEEHREELERFIKQQEEALASQVPSNLWQAIDQFSKKEDPGKAPTTGQSIPETVPSSSSLSSSPQPSQDKGTSKS